METSGTRATELPDLNKSEDELEYFDALEEVNIHEHGDRRLEQLRRRNRMVEMSYRMGTMDLYSPPFMNRQTIFLCDVRNKQYNEFKRVTLKHLPDLESCRDLFTFVKRSCSLNPPVSSSDDVVACKTKSNEFEPYVFEKVSFDEFLDRYMFSKIFVVLKRKDDKSFMQYFVQNDAKNAGNKLGFAKIQESNTANDIVNFCNHKKNNLDNEMTLHQNNTLFVMNNFCPLQPQKIVERYQIPELSTLYILPKISMQASGTLIREKDNSHYSVSCTSANSFGQLVEMFVEKINKCEGTCLTRKEIRLTYIIRGSTFIIKSDQAVAAAIWQQGHDLPDTIHLWIHIINPESFSMKVRLKSRQKMLHGAFDRGFHNSEEIPDAVIVFCNRGTTIKDVKHNICVQTKIDEDSVKIFNNSNQSVLPDSYCIGEIETPRPTLTCVQQKPSRIKVEVTIDDCANNIIEDTVEAYDHSTCQRLREIIVSRLHLQDELKLDLFFGGTGKCFDRENTLSDAGTVGPPLVRATYYRRRIIIFAKLRDQHLSRITINNPEKFTVGQLKRSIVQKHAFATNVAINVIWNGQCLFEGQTIDSCGISHGNIIVVTCGSRKTPPPPFLTVFVARFDDCSKEVEEWFAVKEEVTQSLKFLSRLTEESTTAIMDAFTSIMKDHTLDSASAATVETTRQLSFAAFNGQETRRPTVSHAHNPSRPASFEKNSDQSKTVHTSNSYKVSDLMSDTKDDFDYSQGNQNAIGTHVAASPCKESAVLNVLGQLPDETSEVNKYVTRPSSLSEIRPSRNQDLTVGKFNKTEIAVSTTTTTTSRTSTAVMHSTPTCAQSSSTPRMSPPDLKNDASWVPTEETTVTQTCYEHNDTGEVFFYMNREESRRFRNRHDYQQSSTSCGSVTSDDEVPIASPGRPSDVKNSTKLGVGTGISKEWKTLGRQLQLCETELDNIEHSTRSLKEKGIGVIQTWLNKNGSEATNKRLGEALVACDQRRLAEIYNLS